MKICGYPTPVAPTNGAPLLPRAANRIYPATGLSKRIWQEDPGTKPESRTLFPFTITLMEFEA